MSREVLVPAPHRRKMHTLNSPKEEHSHQRRICATLNVFRQNKELCDVTLWCRGLELEAHKAVLAAASPYFLGLFLTSGTDGRKEQINLDNLQPHGMTEVLQYIYTGQAEVDAGNVQSIMEAAQLFKMEGMYLKCRQVLLRKITGDTFAHVWNIADKLSDNYIRSAVLEFVTSNLSDLRHNNGNLKTLSSDRLRIILTDFRVPVDKALDVAIAWARELPAERNSEIGPLFSALKIESLSQSYLEKLIRNEKVMCDVSILRPLIAAELQKKNESPEDSSQKCVTIQEPKDGPKTFILVFSEFSGQTIMHNYCLEDNTWSRSEMSPFDVRVMGTAMLDNLVYCAGGKAPCDDTVYLTSLHVYSPLDYDLRTLSPMSEPRALLALAAHSDGNLYAVGGFNDSGYLSLVERYEPAKDKWTTLEPLSEARSGVACISVNEKLFAIGGRNDYDILATVEYYTCNTEQWTKASPMPLPRSHASAGSLGGKVYVVGGFWSVQDLLKTSLGSIQCYAETEDLWSLADCSIPSTALITAALAWQQNLYVLTAAGRIFVYCPDEQKVRELKRAPGSKGIARSAFIIRKN